MKIISDNTSEKMSSAEEFIQAAWQILKQVNDPEIPVLSILDLGIVKDILILVSPGKAIKKDVEVEVVITPTYSGCPAMDVIAMNIRITLFKEGFKAVKITQQLSPAWSTGLITAEGRNKLRSYGIAPPQTSLGKGALERVNKVLFNDELEIECPQCRSTNTKLLSQFGSTACKALYQCADCKEPFDYFKCH